MCVYVRACVRECVCVRVCVRMYVLVCARDTRTIVCCLEKYTLRFELEGISSWQPHVDLTRRDTDKRKRDMRDRQM